MKMNKTDAKVKMPSESALPKIAWFAKNDIGYKEQICDAMLMYRNVLFEPALVAGFMSSPFRDSIVGKIMTATLKTSPIAVYAHFKNLKRAVKNASKNANKMATVTGTLAAKTTISTAEMMPSALMVLGSYAKNTAIAGISMHAEILSCFM